jgi:hypothetical protein
MKSNPLLQDKIPVLAALSIKLDANRHWVKGIKKNYRIQIEDLVLFKGAIITNMQM